MAARRGEAFPTSALDEAWAKRRTLKEFAPARAAGALTFEHEIGFRGALPHKSKEALDKVTVDGHALGGVGLRRTGNAWNVVLVCECP